MDALEQLLSGMASFQEVHPCLALGGDISKSLSGMMICVTFLGWQEASSRLLTRDGARAGDRILVTGMPGKAALGLQCLRRFGLSAIRNPMTRPFVEAYLKPAPPIALARVIAQKGLAHAAIDTSDGLVQDLGHMSRLSCLQSFLNLEAFPLEGLKALSSRLGVQPESLALSGGEDYGLVLAVPQEVVEDIKALGEEWNIEVHDVGHFQRGNPEVWVCRQGQEPFQLKRGGYEHFRDEASPP
jgi:thiamine-monophosphate kinase